MNLQDIRDTAVAQVVSLGSSEDLINANKNFMTSMINKAYHDIERKALWKFSEKEEEVSALSNERVCPDVPEDMGIPLMVYSNKTKSVLGYHDERQRFHSLEDKGTVQEYGLWSEELRWYPLPKGDESFLLRYYATWPSLVEDIDTPLIPPTWQYLLVDYATYQLALRLPPTGDRFLPYSKAQPYLESYQMGLGDMIESPLTMKTWDAVPAYDFEDEVLGLQEW